MSLPRKVLLQAPANRRDLPAGTARAGAASRVARRSRIIAGGLLAGALLSFHVHFRVAHPGPLPQHFAQPALVSPVAGRPPPPDAPAPGVPGGRARTASSLPDGEDIRVDRGVPPSAIDPALADAYDHFQAGRTEPARRLYEQVAAADPRNVDALLGMGAIAQLGNEADIASRIYLRVLEIDPRNAHAQAALIGQLGRADPRAAESRLKALIARESSPFLYFTLGNLYADQDLWPQAQQAWFKAHHLQPGNADYAFNLAIGLERIARARLAIAYLRTAIGLAESGARASFDVAAARRRLALLEATRLEAP